MSNSTETMEVILTSGGLEMRVNVPAGCDLGYIRGLRNQLEELGVGSNFNLAVNNVGQDDNKILAAGDRISFRPRAGEKG